MQPKVYVETTVISYLAARPSRDVIVYAHQRLSKEWWESHRARFQLFVSELVLREAQAGDPEAAQERLGLLPGIPLLAVTPSSLTLSKSLIQAGALPVKATADALHISIAAVNGMEYLLTWNCRHIANAELRPVIEGVIRSQGFEPPILCTPEELMGE
jgi:hypothetical protein